MDLEVKKTSIKRPKKWKIVSSEDEIEEIQSPNLNPTRGHYVEQMMIYSTSDIRKYEKIEKQSILQKASFPLLRSKIYPNWICMDRNWLTHQYLRGVVQTPSTIDTSFPLTMLNRNQLQEIRIVNTRTADMEFSTSSNLAIACNCIKGGYLSLIKASSLMSDESSLHSVYNDRLSQPTQFYYKEPIVSIQWKEQDTSILCTRRACREVSVFDVHSLQSRTLAVLPYFVEQVQSVSVANCYIVSMGDGKLKMIDCRMNNRFTSNWTTDNTTRKLISCIAMTDDQPYEVIVAYKNPVSLDRIDIRNTKLSPISGKQSPRILSSVPLHFPNQGSILTMTPVLTQDEVLATLSTGDIVAIHKTEGNTRLYTSVDSTMEMIRFDGIVTKPFRHQLIQNRFYIPSLVRRSNVLPLYDLDLSLCRFEIPCSGEVVGCCYSDVLKRLIVSCGYNTLEHRLCVFSFVLFKLSFKESEKVEHTVPFKKGCEEMKARTVISGGKRPNPSDLGS